MLCLDLQRAVHKIMPANIKELKQCCKDKLAKIDGFRNNQVIAKGVFFLAAESWGVLSFSHAASAFWLSFCSVSNETV